MLQSHKYREEDRAQKRLHQKAFEDIFNLIALNKEKAPDNKPDGKINREQLEELFTLIDYKTTELKEITAALFKNRNRITFLQFMGILNLKMDHYTKLQETNAFKFLAGEDDSLMDIKKVIKILIQNGMNLDDVQFFEQQIKKDARFYDKDSNSIIYPRFLKSMQMQNHF